MHTDKYKTKQSEEQLPEMWKTALWAYVEGARSREICTMAVCEVALGIHP
jgi:hypothetical protein